MRESCFKFGVQLPWLVYGAFNMGMVGMHPNVQNVLAPSMAVSQILVCSLATSKDNGEW